MTSRLKTTKRFCGATCWIFYSDSIVEAIWAKFNAFLAENPLASPRRLVDLIAMSRGGSAVVK
jgi:hypothetical protein